MYFDYIEDDISQVGIVIDHHIKNNTNSYSNEYIVRVYPTINENCIELKEEKEESEKEMEKFDVDITVDVGKFGIFNEVIEVLKRIAESYLYKKRKDDNLLIEEREVIKMILMYLDKEEYDVSFLETTKLGNILEFLKESIDEKEEIVNKLCLVMAKYETMAEEQMSKMLQVLADTFTDETMDWEEKKPLLLALDMMRKKVQFVVPDPTPMSTTHLQEGFAKNQSI